MPKKTSNLSYVGENMKKAEGVISPPGAPKIGEGGEPPKTPTAIKNPMKVGSTAVKKPKSKAMADPFAKPSLFFKNEDFKDIKHPSIEKLRAFLEISRGKKQSI